MKTRINLIAIALFTLLAVSCSNDSQPKDFDYGTVENNTYQNSFFDFKIDLPTDWVVQTREQLENLAEVGKELVAGDNKNMKAAIKASEINSANLLAVFKYEVGAAVDYNPNFMLVAENLKNAPGIKTGSDYLFQTRKLLKQAQVQYSSIDEEFKKEMINGQEFYLMNASIDYLGLSINQAYYSTIKDGFCVSAIISFADDKQKMDLEKVINSISFSK